MSVAVDSAVMPKTHQVHVRLDEEDHAWLEAERERVEWDEGVDVTVPDIVRRLIRRARLTEQKTGPE